MIDEIVEKLRLSGGEAMAAVSQVRTRVVQLTARDGKGK
jgi:hypothetical protein